MYLFYREQVISVYNENLCEENEIKGIKLQKPPQKAVAKFNSYE